MLSADTLATIAETARVNLEQAERAIVLLRSGNTIPYIARYRKDETGGLSELKLETIDALNHRYTAIEQRRAAILANIESQGKLTADLRATLETCRDARALEDLYLPFKRKRNATTSVARARGLDTLADWLMSTAPVSGTPEEEAARYVAVDRGVDDAEAALAGAKQLVTERLAENFGVRSLVRERFTDSGILTSHSTKTSEGQKTRYNEFYTFNQKLSEVPSSRLLCILRGVREGALRVEIVVPDESVLGPLLEQFVEPLDDARAAIVRDCLEDAYRRQVAPVVEEETLEDAATVSNETAIRLLCDSLRTLLLTPPAGPAPMVGVYPISRSALAAAAIDPCGEVVAHLPRLDIAGDRAAASEESFRAFVAESLPEAVAVGNGTGFREIDRFVRASLAALETDRPYVSVVNDSGAAQYGTSKLGQEELPDLAPPVRTAVSLARRFQDPLREYVKLEPRTFHLGPNQRDVNPKRLRERVHNTIVSCVNHVGVDVNTASAELLRFVAGMQYGTAQNIVAMRNDRGPFASREELVEVPGIGANVYEQCAGFLRLPDAQNPLDATAVHPSHYPVVERIASVAGKSIRDLLGDSSALDTIKAEDIAGEDAGPRTVGDILKELRRPGRDPRPRYRAPKLGAEGRAIADLSAGTDVEGVVTNVTDFGAFVDVGVGQDGLVHLSEMARQFVRNPRQLVRIGEPVRVRVVTVDTNKPRISLSMKAVESGAATRRGPQSQRTRKAKSTNAQSHERGSARRDSKQGDRQNAASKGKRNQQRRRSKDRESSRKPSPAQPKYAEPLNTQLADQLAALREKLAADQ